MTRIDRNASLEEKMEHIMREIGLAGYQKTIPRKDLEEIIMIGWGHNRLTVRMALECLKRFGKVSRIAPELYRINFEGYTQQKEDELAVEKTFAAKTIEEDYVGMLRIFRDRHPPGMKPTSEDQDMTWIRAVKGRYGLQDMRDRDLLKKLQEGLA